MGLLSGTFTYKKFQIVEELPSNFKENLVKNLPRYAFKEINPAVNPEFSIGWINPFDQVDTNLAMEKVLFGKYILLGVRKDKKSVSAALLKAQLSDAVKAQLRERRGRKLSREEMVSLKDTVREVMLKAVSPTTNFYEMVWNYETQEVYFSATGGKTVIEFIDLFQDTFNLTLEEINLVTRTESFIESKGLGIEIADIEQSFFGA